MRCRIDYNQQMSNLPMDPQALDQTLNMSPMDLFDSIFWDAYPVDGLDQLGGGFDYSQAIYPQF